MELISEINGVKFYEDFNSSNPEETKKTLSHLNEPVVWIAGGENCEGDFGEIFNEFFDKLYLLCLIGENTNYIRSFALRESFTNIYVAENLGDAIKYSYLSSEKGTVVLFSPASTCDGSLRDEFIIKISDLRRDEDAKGNLL